jgi:hypothetical protein
LVAPNADVERHRHVRRNVPLQLAGYSDRKIDNVSIDAWRDLPGLAVSRWLSGGALTFVYGVRALKQAPSADD